MTQCPVCGEWHDTMKGVYICPKCGSREMVDKANEPTAYDDLLRRLREAVKEIQNYRAVVTNPTVHYVLFILGQYLPELEDK